MGTFRIPFQAMGSACEMVLCADDQARAQEAAQIGIEEVHRIEYKYSRYRGDSIVSQINAAAGSHWTDCDDETLSLLDFAASLFESSGGLFDITSGLLRKAWDFKRANVPASDVLSNFCGLIGWQRLERSGAAVRLAQGGMEIDFGGFGKEYAADRAATRIAEAGIHHGYVNLAGDMRIIGPRPGGQPWVMGIQDPRIKDRICATLPVAGGALATSGDYERYFEKNGARYCHILNPHTGLPVSYWRSVSVLAPMAIVAGGCATIAMLMERAGLEFLYKTGFNFLAIDCDGQIYQTDGAKDFDASMQTDTQTHPH